jgi:transcriptional regulator with XRE-family HTH domain
MVYHSQVPRSAQTKIDPQFWERLRKALQYQVDSTGLTQRELAAKLGIDPTTLNNFLNRQSKSVGGLAVALACTLVDLVCDGTKIGRVLQSQRARLPEPIAEQLVLEFDRAFEIKHESKHATIVLRKRTARNASLRLSIRKIG